jgi:hypothetical protein
MYPVARIPVLLSYVLVIMILSLNFDRLKLFDIQQLFLLAYRMVLRLFLLIKT